MPSILSGMTTSPQLGIPAIATPPAPDMRTMDDTTGVRQRIHDNVLAAAQGIEPIGNNRYTLGLANVAYAGPDKFSVKDQKRAILTGQTLERRLRGDWQLTDNATGGLVDTKSTTLAKVPFYTQRGTFILGGNEYTLANQMRLRSGVFARRKSNGELESHVNVMPGKGRAHRLYLDPKNGVFRIQMGQAKLPLMPLLKAMGVSDKELRSAWGNDLTAANMKVNDGKVIDKLYERLTRPKERDADATPESRASAVAAAMQAMELDPEVTKRTLGQAISNVGPAALIAATSKLLRISRDEEPEDDRDALAFQKFMGPEDLLAERLGKDKQSLRQLLWKATARGNLGHIQPGTFTKSIRTGITGSGLGQPLESINPVQVFEQGGRVSRMGVGGIPSLDAVPDEARNVQPSHFGFVDPLVTPESGKVGVDSRLSHRAKKGSDGRVYAPFTDTATGEEVWKSPQDMADAVIAFPGSMKRGKSFVAAMNKGKLEYVPRESVQFELPAMEGAFAPVTNMVPMKSAMKGQRVAMAQRMITQALPLMNPEAPLVQSGIPGKDRSFEREYATQMGAVRASQAGRVLGITDDAVQVQYEDGTKDEVELYSNFPYNRKTFIHQTPTVRPGQSFSRDELLVRSNYTDETGTAALGANARVAYLPYKGWNFEDAIVISQGYADRLTSSHMYQHGVDRSDDLKTAKSAFVSVFPSIWDRKTLETMDEHGVVKPGTIVKKGDPLVLGVKKKARTHSSLHNPREKSFTDESELWTHDHDGEVTDVEMTDKGINVSVKSISKMHVGDKLSGRYGDKGVIAKIVDDDKMPQDQQGRPYEVLANPLGVISRTNPAQMIEAVLGKIAEKTGKPINVHDFEDIEDLTEWAQQQLRKHGMTDLEDVIDGETQRKITDVFTGNRYFMKLHHTAESKAQGRGQGGYTAEGAPSKGGESGSKRVSLLDVNALLSHGATEVIRDASLVRGQQHPEYWRMLMAGHKPPTPNVPVVYRKFVNSLRGAGINVVREGTRTNVMSMSNADVTALAGDREITSAETVNWKEGLKPIKGGLFDEGLTGGHRGNRWSYIKLPEPMPNPAMEEPMRRVLGLTRQKFLDVLAGKEKLKERTGPGAISAALGSLNIDREIDRSRQEIKSGRKTLRDAAVRRLGYLKSAKRVGLHPKDWMLDKVPVLPPMFRPVSTMQGSGRPMVADPNFLYKEIFDAAQNLKKMKDQVDDVGDERLAVYNAFRGVTGLGDPIHPKNQERQVKGLLKHVFGGSPKLGTVQRKLLGSTTDLVARAVISPDPDLDLDDVGIPEKRAWEIYQPFIVRNLVRSGVPRHRAVQEVKTKSDLARQAMLRAMESRPVIINRAPVLHRYGMMAFRPRLVKDDTMHVNPFIVGGFGADFDGDAMQFHVPSTDEAAEEAVQKMLPSRNLLSPSNFKAHQLPSKEFVGGLYSATAKVDKKKRPQVFKTKRDAVAAYKRGEIDVDRRVQIMEN